MTFTLKNIVATGVVTNRSALYTVAQDIEFAYPTTRFYDNTAEGKATK